MGSAGDVLTDGVALLDESRSVFDAMLEGWGRQQQSRSLAPGTMTMRERTVRRFHQFTGQYPWFWQPVDVEDFSSSLLSQERPVSHSTIRSYQISVRLFCEFITDSRYRWGDECQRRFGTHPIQICHRWNTTAHLAEFEGRPQVRAFTYDELEQFFDACDARVERARTTGRKGAAAALRDSQMFKTMYAWGLRRAEVVGLDLADLRTNAHAPQWGPFGVVHVRHGKAKRGSAPQRRFVLSVPEFDWAIEGLQSYVDEVRDLFGATDTPALWVTERKTRVGVRYVDKSFAETRAAAGLPDHLHAHCLRHGYVTHLTEFGYPAQFISEQVGHSHSSTTAIYTHVSDDFKNQALARAMERVFPAIREDPQQ